MRGSKLLETWKQLQLSHYGGRYSVHRLLALESYTKKTSSWRAFLVCIATPLPMVALAFIQESLPLRDPQDGWSANYGHWIRAAMLTFAITCSSTAPASYFIDGIDLSVRQLVALSACASMLLTCSCLVISAYFIWPLPFSLLTMSPIFIIAYIVSFSLVMGADIIRRAKAQAKQLQMIMKFLGIQNLMVFLYPVYEFLFRSAKGSHYQLPVILLLPLIKVLVKNIMRRCIKHLEDMVPETVIFTVDFFNAIYVATCMQATTSTLSIVAITLTDLTQTIVMLYGLHRQTASLSTALQHAAASDFGNQDKLLDVLSSLCRNSAKFKKQSLDGIRIHSCLRSPLAMSDITVLDKLSSITKEVQASGNCNMVATVPHRGFASSGSRRALCCCFNRRIDSVHPGPSALVKLTGPVIPEEGVQPPRNKTDTQCCDPDHSTFLRDSLAALFTIECLLITSYLEAVMPLFYSAYMLVMVNLPSAKYHTDMAGITHQNVEQTVFPVLLFGLLQASSFVVLVFMVQRNCKIRALDQLSFVLESQKSLIQTKLIGWMMVTLCFRVIHFGVDFTFKFSGLGYKFMPSSS